MGRAHRMNAIILNRDVLSCDMVDAALLGIEPQTVGYLKRPAKRWYGRPIGFESVSGAFFN